MPNDQPENIQTSNIIETEKIIFGNINVINQKNKRSHESGGEQGGVWGKV